MQHKCIYNPTTGSTSPLTITNGMISVARVADSSTQGTFGVDSGKWYFEVRYNSGQVDGYTDRLFKSGWCK